MLRDSSFFVPLEYAGVFKDVREDNTNLVVDVLLELFGREGSVALAGSVTLFKQLGVNLACPVGVGDCSRVRGQLTVDGIGFLVICQALLHN